MDSTIYKKTVDPYVKQGLPNTADLQIGMLDTMLWTEVARTARQSPAYHQFVLNRMIKDIQIIVVPEIILRECSGSGKQKNMDETRFNKLYDPAFQAISKMINIHVVTFSDMENMMLNSNGGKKDYALRKALMIANELFENNSAVKAALATVQQFSEIEDALTVIPDDAGERVILFYTMLFLNEYWSVDVFTNEVAVYTDRVTIASKEKLREALGSIRRIEDFYEAFSITSYDVVLFDVMVEHDAEWSEIIKSEFINQCRNKKGRNIRVNSSVANYSNVEPCSDNKEFLRKYVTWRQNLTRIIF